jgi:hypothetical protein
MRELCFDEDSHAVINRRASILCHQISLLQLAAHTENPFVSSSIGTDGTREWPMYPGKLAKLELQPDFGWLGVLIAPILPKIYAWFDPNSDWNDVGGLYDRFHKGLHILRVRDSSH